MREILRRALERRRALGPLDACRLFHEEGVEGLFVDRYGPAAVVISHRPMDTAPVAAALLELVEGLSAVYLHRRGEAEKAALLAGVPPPMPLFVSEGGLSFEVRLDEGFSTGLFADQRENRRALAEGARGLRVLNAFAHTCTFGVALAAAGAGTSNVDLSNRYLEWGRRNYARNGIDPDGHRFHRMDAFRYLAWARRKGLSFDLVILDPPTFSSGSRARGAAPFSAERDYPRLVREAAPLVTPGGRLFLATNAGPLIEPGALLRAAREGLGREPRLLPLPPAPPDYSNGRPSMRAILLRP